MHLLNCPFGGHSKRRLTWRADVTLNHVSVSIITLIEILLQFDTCYYIH
jgi:hypothetical protein